ncbi:MAG: hypothetical protein WBG54_08830 [Acidobacteriaceae bacterium]
MLFTAAPKISVRLLAFTALAFLAGSACAQTQPAGPSCSAGRNADATYRTFYLTHATDEHSFIEIQTVLRNLLQEARIVGVHDQSAITVCGTDADLQLARKVISDLDHARKSWRLTYTVTRAGSSQPAQRIVLVVASGEHAELKQGSRLPLVTGTTNSSQASDQEVQYIDIGLNLTAILDGTPDSLQLHTKIEQSALSDEKSGIGAQDPVIHQTVLDGTVTLLPGKPQVLGTLEMPDGSGRQEISVTAEPAS